jgi:hypothetical protein
VLDRLALVSTALGVRVLVELAPGDGVLLHPNGTREVRDRRFELRLERRRLRELERSQRKRRARERRRRTRALAKLEAG